MLERITRFIPGIFKRHAKKSIGGLILLILIGWGISRAIAPKQPEYITELAQRGELRQTVEAVGTVISERELELKFGASGIVSQVFVKEGDNVKAGQKLAQLRGGSLSASIASQAAALQSAQADLRALEQGNRPEDIAIAEADLQNKNAALASARQTYQSAEENIVKSEQQLKLIHQEANVALGGQVTTALSSVSQELTTVETMLSTIQDVFNRTDVNDAITKNNPAGPDTVRRLQSAAQQAISSARSMASAAGSDYGAAIQALSIAQDAANSGVSAMNGLFSLISSLQESQYFTASSKESLKASIGTDRSTIQTAATSLATSLSSLQNASASYDTKISSQEGSITSLKGTRDRAKTDILSYESAVRSAQAQLDLKRAGARQTDIDAARARVRQAQANLARSQADFSDTILTAPVNGTVTHVNIRIGESLPAIAAVTLLGESPYRVDMFVSEIDIPKVQLTQSGSIELDSFRGVDFALRVGDIDPTSTDKDGVPKYRVRLDFVHRHDDLKIGMTGDAQITTGIREDVVSIPQRAVIENDEGKEIVRVLLKDGTVEEKHVETGMESESGDIEIVSGVDEGEIVIVLEKK